MDYEIMMNGNVRIGQRAPDFEATTTMGNISLNDYKGKWVVLFSHPGDFTPRLHNRDNFIFKSKYIFRKFKCVFNRFKCRFKCITSCLDL